MTRPVSGVSLKQGRGERHGTSARHDVERQRTRLAKGRGTHVDAPELRLFVMGLFFIFGGITSLNDVIIPKLKELFTLNYTQAMLVQFCFFTAYLVIGIPGAKLVKKIGYMRGAVAGLLTMMVGCLLFIPASQNAVYGLFLFALFVLASGVVIVQVVANPLISLLGKPETAHSRLTFAQAFNSLGTTIFPTRRRSVLILGSPRNDEGRGSVGRQARRLSHSRKSTAIVARAISASPSRCWWSRAPYGCSATASRARSMKPVRVWRVSIC